MWWCRSSPGSRAPGRPSRVSRRSRYGASSDPRTADRWPGSERAPAPASIGPTGRPRRRSRKRPSLRSVGLTPRSSRSASVRPAPGQRPVPVNSESERGGQALALSCVLGLIDAFSVAIVDRATARPSDSRSVGSTRPGRVDPTEGGHRTRTGSATVVADAPVHGAWRARSTGNARAADSWSSAEVWVSDLARKLSRAELDPASSPGTSEGTADPELIGVGVRVGPG